MSKTLIIDLEHGRAFAPCMAYYRIRNERDHRLAMDHVAAMGGPIPEDEYGRDDNILISDDDAEEIIVRANHRKLRDWRDGWDVGLRLDRWEAFAYYGYDAGDCVRVVRV